MTRFYYFIYTLIIALLLPFAVLRLLKKSLKNPDYRRRIGERLSFFRGSTPNNAIDIWIHSVSVGEFLAIKPLIERLLTTEKYKILVTTTTPTGSQMVRYNFAGKVEHVYLPFDLPLFNQRFLTQFNPKIAVFVETEVWPNLIYQLKKRNIPSLLINARLSERSFKRYQTLGRFSHAVFRS